MPDLDDGNGRQRRRSKVLFVAEAVTLAHVVRPFTMARALESERYEITLASAPPYRNLWRKLPGPVRTITSVDPAEFLDNLAKGRPLYSEARLRSYVDEDLAVIREVEPDVIVGDCRMSLSVSARVAGVPYVAITNAYWSPYARTTFPLPELPMVHVLGLPLARAAFAIGRPIAFAMHTRPLNRVRRTYGLPTLPPDLRYAYTDADYTLYADAPEMVPTFGAPPSHHYLGPILWSPEVATPAWWDELESDRPIVYVNLGSSGPANLLPTVLDGLAGLPVDVIAATLGRSLPRPAPANVLTADYLPGQQAADRARLVICNGGSPSAHQALAVGTPVIGIASNMDQHLNMESIERLGAGETLRSDRISAARVRAVAARILDRPTYEHEAGRLKDVFSRYDAAARFRGIIEGIARPS